MIPITRRAFPVLQILPFLVPAFCAAQPGGVSPEWDIRETLAALTAETKRLEPALEQVNPRQWLAKGAPEAYIDQWKAVRNEIGYLQRTAGEMSKRPDRITLALETFLRLQSVEAMMQSLMEGVRRYQNPALADLLQSFMNENAGNGQKLRDYLVELVASKEAEFEIVDREAQRCRAELISRPPAPAGARKGGQGK